MATQIDQIRAIIALEYRGSEAITRYLSDLARAGAITEQQMARMAAALSAGAAGQLAMGAAVREIVLALGGGTASVSNFVKQADALARGTTATIPILARYATAINTVELQLNKEISATRELTKARRALRDVAIVSLVGQQLGITSRTSTASPAPAVPIPPSRPVLALPATRTAGQSTIGEQRTLAFLSRIEQVIARVETSQRQTAVGFTNYDPTRPEFASTANDQSRRLDQQFLARNIEKLEKQIEQATRATQRQAVKETVEYNRNVLQAGHFGPQYQSGVTGELGGETIAFLQKLGSASGAAAENLLRYGVVSRKLLTQNTSSLGRGEVVSELFGVANIPELFGDRKVQQGPDKGRYRPIANSSQSRDLPSGLGLVTVDETFRQMEADLEPLHRDLEELKARMGRTSVFTAGPLALPSGLSTPGSASFYADAQRRAGQLQASLNRLMIGEAAARQAIITAYLRGGQTAITAGPIPPSRADIARTALQAAAAGSSGSGIYTPYYRSPGILGPGAPPPLAIGATVRNPGAWAFGGDSGGARILSQQAEAVSQSLHTDAARGVPFNEAMANLSRLGLSTAQLSAVFAELRNAGLAEAAASRQAAAADTAQAGASRMAAAADAFRTNGMKAIGAGTSGPAYGTPGGPTATTGWGGGGGSSGGGGRGGFIGDFTQGFKGRGGVPAGEQLGQSFKFAVAYGAAYKIMFAITETLSATLQAAIDYQNAVINLKIATGQTQEQTEKLADQLGATSARAGLGTSAGIEAGARAIGLYGLTNAPQTQQDAAAISAAKVATQIVFNNPNIEMEAAQRDIGAISQAYGLDSTQGQRIADLDAYIGKQFGVDAGSTLEPVAQTGSLANQGGFSLEEIISISALLQSRTGQEGGTVAGYMAQILSRGGEGSLTDVAKKYGVDTDQNLKGVLEDLSQKYVNASPKERQDIAVAAGRGKVQSAFNALLDDSREVFATAQEAVGTAPGTSSTIFEKRLETVGGHLAELGGQMQIFAKLLGQSGMLAVLGLGIETLQGLFDGLNGLLTLFNSLDGGIRAVIISLAFMAAAAKTGAVSSIATGLLARGGATLTRAIGPSAWGNVSGYAQGTRLINTISPTGAPVATPLASRAGIGAAAGAYGSALAVPAALAAALTIGIIKTNADKVRVALSQSDDLIHSFVDIPQNSRTASDYSGLQSSLLTSSKDVKTSGQSKFMAALSFGQFNNGTDEAAADLKRSADWAGEQAATLLRMEKQGIVPGGAPDLDFTDADTLASQLSDMAAQGGTATTALEAVEKALFRTGEAARQAAVAFRPERSAKDIGGQAYLDLRDSVTDTGEIEGFGIDKEDLQNRIGDVTSEEALSGKVQEVMEDLNIQSARELRRRRQEVIDALAPTLTSDITEGWEGPADLGDTGVAKVGDLVEKVLLDAIMGNTQKAVQAIREATDLSPAAVVIAQGQLQSGYDTLLGQLPANDFKGRTANRRGLLQGYQHLASDQRKQGNEVTPKLLEDIENARADLVNTKLAELENLRAVAQANSVTARGDARAGRSFMNKEIARALKGGDIDSFAKIIELGGKAARDIILGSINVMVQAARTALLEAEKTLSPGSRSGPDYVAVDDLLGPLRKRLDGLLGLRRGVKNIPAARGKGSNQFLTDDASAAAADNDTAAQIAAARAAAGVAPDDTVGAAAATLQGARADLAAIKKKHGVAYWDAVAAVNQAQYDYAQAQADAASAAAAANIAPDDAVGAAQNALNTARQQLGRATPGTVAYSEALGAVNTAEFDLAQAHNEVADAAGAASAAKLGGGIAPAQQQIAAASRAMADATKGTAAYYQALASYYDGQQALADAIADYQNNKALLRIDTTNPLKVANNAVTQAAKKLAADRASGKGADVIAADQVALQSAQNDAEQTAFSQRLEQVQTNEELGRTSHAAYIRYLNHERDRLESIGHRTFQQQQQLNQIDQLLKDAATEMQGQFNLGSIKLPTPYQVRRFVEQNVPGGGKADRLAGPQVDQRTISIQVDGADTRKVRQIINQALSSSGRRSNAPRRG